MSDRALFFVMPLVSMAMLVVAATIRLARESSSTAIAPASPALDHRRWYRRLPISAALLGHVAMFAWPTQLLSWIRDPARLLALEAVSFTVGTVATLAVGLMIRRRFRSTSSWPIGDVVFLSVLSIAMTSGLALAVVHRWAAAWSLTTLTPYVRSVLSLQPDVSRLDGMPYLVRLHVGSAFLLVSTFPFSTLFEVVIRALTRFRPAVSHVVSTMDRGWGLARERVVRRGQRLIWPEEDD
jgi:nitrate reductase gamma subunit